MLMDMEEISDLPREKMKGRERYQYFLMGYPCSVLGFPNLFLQSPPPPSPFYLLKQLYNSKLMCTLICT